MEYSDTHPAAVIPPTTTAEENRKTEGQRKINLIWELTQAFVAVTVTLATLYTSISLALKDKASDASFLLLSNAFFLVIGFYFGRTNHQRIGGIGSNEIGR